MPVDILIATVNEGMFAGLFSFSLTHVTIMIIDHHSQTCVRIQEVTPI